MSPINQQTIRIETWHNSDGSIRTQVLAEGDRKDPGLWLYERGIKPENINYLHSPKKIVDINVNKEGMVGNGEPDFLPTPYGVWQRIRKE